MTEAAMAGPGNVLVRRAASLFLLLACLILSLPASAANKPCSGRKGGVSHCQGDTFVCNDGSVSASKRSCSASSSGGFAPAPAERSAAPAAGNNCSCRSGAYCTGPRGGRYCYSDSGRKSYLRK
jgi:hypothetical protein